MSDEEDGPSDFENLGGYNDSEGDLDEIAMVLDDQDRVSEGPDDEDTTDSEEDEEDTPELPEHYARGNSSKQPRIDNTDVPGISTLILPLLQAGYPAWKAERGNKRKKVWKDILRDLRVLPEHSILTQSQWDMRGQLYLRWMRRQGRTKPKKSDFFAAPKWTLRRVVKQEKGKRINEILQTEYGVQMGSAGMLERYQEALTQAIGELSPAETLEMQQKAEQWNEQTEPDSVKARFATREMAPLMKKFTEAMWKRGGVRMVVLAGYKDEQNAWMTTCFDYNNHFDDGLNFRDASTIQGPWDRYIRHCFRDDGDSDEASEHDNGSAGAEGPRPKKSKNNLGGEAALQLVVRDDGGIWIPDLLGRNRSDLQALVRAYLTAHYRKVCKNPKASAPFKKLAQFQDRLFAAEHLPEDFTFPSDPSHMKTTEATRFLQFIRARQQKVPDDVFGFQYTLNREGDLVELTETTDDSDTEALVPRGKQHPQSKHGTKSSATRPSRHGAVSETSGRLPSARSNTHAEGRDAEDVAVARKSVAAAGPPRPRPAPRRPNTDEPHMDNELPGQIEDYATGPSADKIGQAVKGKGKDLRRPKAAVEVERVGALSKQRPLPAGTSATSQKVGPPIGVKRSKDNSKAKGLPKENSAPNGHLGTTSSQDVPAGQPPDRQRSGPLKSALKSSTLRRTNDSQGNIPTLANHEPRNTQPSRPSRKQGTARSNAHTTSDGVTPPASVRIIEGMDNPLEPSTPRRSNRERRAPARVDEEEPRSKRSAPSGPLTTQFKAKRRRFN